MNFTQLKKPEISPVDNAERHLLRQGYTPTRLIVCLDMLHRYKDQIETHPKLAAIYDWTLNVQTAAISGSRDLQPAPYTFEDVLSEAANQN